MSFLLYISFYFLTYLGFLLGSSTKEEHKEIKHLTLSFNEVLKTGYFLLLFIIFYNNIIISLVLGLIFILYLINKIYYKNTEMIKILNILLIGVSILTLIEYKFEMIGIVLVLIFTLIVEKSFEKFNLKENIYTIIIYILIYISYYITGNLIK